MKVTELADPSEWKSPEEAAAKFRELYSEDSHGVLLDSLVENRRDAADARHHLQEVIIHLDYVADRGDFGARPLDEMTKMHRHAIALHDWFEEYERAITDELRDVRGDDEHREDEC